MASVNAPWTGWSKRMRPATIASTADSSDHQKPGIPRAQNVSANPAMPLIMNIQPRRMVTARLASGGTMIAASPRITRMIPSIRNAFQCSRTAALMSDCSFSIFWGRVMIWSPDAHNAVGAVELHSGAPGRRKTLSHGADPVAAQNIDGAGDHQQGTAEE